MAQPYGELKERNASKIRFFFFLGQRQETRVKVVDGDHLSVSSVYWQELRAGRDKLFAQSNGNHVTN